MILLITSLILAYLMGSLPTAFIVAKFIAKVDIRQKGSGNVGATNVYRVVGKLPGVITLVVDIAKGVVAVGLITPYFHNLGIPLEYRYYAALMALGVVCGHIWNPFLNFRGGKGIAASAGALIILCPGIFSLVALVWFIVFIITRIVSLSSIAASVSFPVLAAVFGDVSLTILAITLCAISIVKHRSNIARLIRGQESGLRI